ncbi:MAG: YfhO family protein, partial [Armatimonadetes bacterium]|nr:YfhO family protein [Armatimonadota bacterium]
YPPRLLLNALFGTPVAINFSLMIHTWLAGFCTFLYARRLGQSPTAATLAGTSWMFCGYVMAWLEHDQDSCYAGLLPLALVLLDVARTRTRAIAGGAIGVGLLMVAGHLQLATYSMLLMAFLLLLRVEDRRQAARLAAAVLLGICLAAPMLLPTAQALTSSQRPRIALDYVNATQRQFLAWMPPTLIAPDAFGSPVNDFALRRVTVGGYWTYLETVVYIGILPLLLAVRGAFTRPARALGIAILVLLILPATPLYSVAMALPGLNRITTTRLTFMWSFLAALIAGFGLDALDLKNARRLAVAALALAVAWILAVAAMGISGLQVLVKQALDADLVRLPNPEFFSPAAYPEAVLAGALRTWSWSSPSVWMPVLALFMSALWLYFGNRRKEIALVIVAIDLMSFGLRFNPLVPRETIFPETPTTQFLRANPGHHRVMGVGTIKPNTALPYRIADVAGYESFYPQPAAIYLSWLQYGGLSETYAPLVFPLTRTDSPLVNLLAVRYFVAYPGQKLEGRLVQDAPLPVYENPRRLPRAYVAGRYRVVQDRAEALRLLDGGHDARSEAILETAAAANTGLAGPATIEEDHPEKVVIRAAGPGVLVLSDGYDPIWTADVDGAPTPVLLANGMFRAVVLQAGDHVVTFRYQPAALRHGVWLAGASLLVLLAVTLLGRRAKGAGAT